MKSTLHVFAWVCWVLIALPANSQNCFEIDSNLINGILGYYPLDGDASDVSGNNNGGIVNGAISTSNRLNQPNTALYFNGTSDYVQIDNIINSNLNVTISGWYKSEVPQGAAFAYFGVNSACCGCDGFGLGMGDGDTWFGPGNYLVAAGCNGINWMPTDFELPPLGTWNHFALVKEPGKMIIYINGQSAHYYITGNGSFSNQNIYLGSAGPGSDAYKFEGSLDEIFVFDRSLSSAEIKQLYNTSNGIHLAITAPDASIINPLNPVELLATPGLAEYQWFVDGNPIPGAYNSTLLVDSPGEYSVSAVSLSGCPAISPTVNILLSMTASECTVPEINGSQELIGYWPFCGNANDISGNGNDGFVSGARLTTDRFGVPNSAYAFNGGGDVIVVENPLAESGVMTISGWYKSNLEQGAAFVYYGVNSPNLGCNGFGTGQGELDWIGSEGNFLVSASGCSFGWRATSTSLPELGTWVHFALVRDSMNYQVYINSELYQTFTAGIEEISPYLFFGGASTVGDYTFDGDLDDISLWNRALTQEEITELYTGEPESPPATCNPLPSNLQQGLVGYWPFCGNANDESGNGNDGTVNGATLTEDRFGNANAAYSFDGVNDYIITEDIGISSSFSAAFFVRYRNYTSYSNQIGGVLISNFTNDFLPLPIGWEVGASIASANLGIGNGQYGLTSNQNLPLDEWHHFAVICNAVDSLTTIYIDGQSIISAEMTFSDEILPFVFGARSNNPPSANYDGSLDDIGIWNRALTPEEVQELYTLDACTFTVYDTSYVTVYDTLTTYETVYDTLYTYETIYDTVTTYVTVTDTLLIDITFTGFEGQPSWLNTVTVFPNPASDHITIDYGNFALMAGYNTVIMDAAGAAVYSSAVNSQQAYIDINAWGAAGVYYMTIYDASGAAVAVRHIVLE
jgi:hypothetical protein